MDWLSAAALGCLPILPNLTRTVLYMAPLNLGSGLPIKLGLFSLCSFILFFAFSAAPPLLKPKPTSTFQPYDNLFSPSCTPEDWSSGSWVKKSEPKQVLKADDVYEASGFLGCASNREVGWHLSSDHENELPWRGNVSAYEWRPAPHCKVPNNYRDSLLTDLVQKGGWLLIGGEPTCPQLPVVAEHPSMDRLCHARTLLLTFLYTISPRHRHP